LGGTPADATINANQLLGATWAAPLAIGTGTAAAGTFTTLTSDNLLVNKYATVSGSLALGSSVAAPGPGNLSMSGNLIADGRITGTTIFQGVNQVCDISGNCTGSTDLWSLANGALFPKNNTVDVLFGATSGTTATQSAKFAFTGIDTGGTPTASISGATNVALFMDGNGNISSTNRNNLTLGNSSTYNTTGNILLNPNGTGNVGIGKTVPLFKLDVAGSASISATLSLGPMNQVDAGTCNVTNAGKQYYDGTANTYYFCNGTAWTAIGAETGVENFWGQTNGALYPLNNTVDLLLGATAGTTATTSAKFAFTGINTGGTPTASISGTANAALFMDGNGNISSTNRNNLVLGNSTTHNTTGNILLNPNGTGFVGIGTTSPGELLSLGTAGSIKGVLSLAGNTSGKITIEPAAAAGTWTFTLPTTTGTSSQVLTTDGSGVTSWQNIPLAGKLLYYFQDTASAVAGDKKMLITPYSPATSFSTGSVGTNGKVLVNKWITDPGSPGLTSIPAGQFEFHVHAAQTAGTKTTVLFAEFWETNSVGSDIAPIATSESTIALGTKTEYSLFASTANTYSLASSSSRIVAKVYENITAGGSNPTVLIYYGGTDDSFAALPSQTIDASNFVPYIGATANVDLGTFKLFADMIGVGTTSPLARLSVVSPAANAIGKAAFLVDQYENQDIFTASASGVTKLTLTNDGTLKLYNATSSISNSSGDITIIAASGLTSFGGNNLGNIATVSAGTGIFTGVIQTATSSAVAYNRLGTNLTDHSGNLVNGSDLLISSDLEVDGNLYLDGGSINNSAGNTVIQFSSTPTTTANSLLASNWLIENSANLGQAALMVNQLLGGDIFTASASGTPKFVISNAGNVGIGLTNPGYKLEIKGTAGLSPLNVASSSGAPLFTIAATGNVGIANTAPSYPLDVNGDARVVDNLYAQKFIDTTSSPTYYLDPAGATSLFIAGGITSDNVTSFNIASVGNKNIILDAGSGNVVIGAGANFGIGKLDAGTIDPPYTIDGGKFATYQPSMTGIKEETTGTVSTGEYVPGVGYRNVIDFSQALTGSDLWLFSKVTDLTQNYDKLVVLLSPAADTKAWYGFDPSGKLSIYTSRPTSVSYRLTAPRFDFTNWNNSRTGGGDGFIIQNSPQWPVNLALNNSGNIPFENLGIQTATNASSSQKYNLVDSTTGQLIEEVASYSKAIIANLTTGLISAKEIATDSFYAFQGTVDHLLVTSGLVAGNIQTKLISPLADGTDVTVQVGSSATPSGQFIVQNSDGNPVASIDNTGNATFSGTLYADAIKSKSLDDIKSLLSQVQTDQQLLSQASGWNINTATNSASINSLAVTDLYVTNQAAVNSLSVTNSLTLGSDLILGSAGNNIDTLSAPLKIQSLAMAPLEIMAGLVTIDTKGNVNIAGDLFVAGRIKSSGLTLTDTQPSASDSASLLTLQNSTGNTVSTVNASGSAQFLSVSTPQLVIAGADATQSGTVVNGVITTNSTVGQAVIPANTTQITIKNPKVTDYTLVYVTPTSSTQNNVLYIKSKQAGQFDVGFATPVNTDVSFNWWIIQVQ
jgi:hypothetical protein